MRFSLEGTRDKDRDIDVAKSKYKRRQIIAHLFQSLSIWICTQARWITGGGDRITGRVRARGRRKFGTTFNLSAHGRARKRHTLFQREEYGIFGKFARRWDIWNDDHASHIPASQSRNNVNNGGSFSGTAVFYRAKKASTGANCVPENHVTRSS